METLKKTHAEIKMKMKNSITQPENSMARLVTRMNQTEHKLSVLIRKQRNQNRTAKTMKKTNISEIHIGNTYVKNDENTKVLNTMEINEGEESQINGVDQIINKFIEENLHKLRHKAHRTPIKQDQKRKPPEHSVVQILSIQSNCNLKVLKTIRKKN